MKSEKKMFLSICIPCYKRCEQVRNTLRSIYIDNQDVDLSEFEVVISDNDPEQEIKSVISEFSEYDNIRYNYTSCAGFMNSYYVLSYAQGEVLKLHNSQVLFKKGALAQIVHDAKRSYTSNSLLFYSNGMLLHNKVMEFEKFDSFLHHVSYWISWSNGFCILKKEFEKAKNIDLNELFPHTSLLLSQYDLKGYIVNDLPLFSNQRIPKRGDHNKFKAFTIDFPSLIVDGYEKGHISVKNKKHILHDVLYDYLPILIFNKYIARIETFESKGFRKNIKNYFPKYSFILVSLLSVFVPFKLIVRRISTKLYGRSKA